MNPQSPDSELDFLNEPAPETASRRAKISPASLVLMVGVALVVAVFGIALVQRNQVKPTEGVAPDFTVTTFDGQTIRLSDLRGQVVVLNFWASWCGPCREEAPALQAVWEQYRERGVTVIGLAWVDSSDQASLDFLREFNVTYPNAPDRGSAAGDAYHIRAVPETFIIDRDGQIQHFLFGASQVNEGNLSRILDEMLAEAA